MKSKYPNSIDSSAELEVIKDNLTKLRAEIFNSYRSAIIQIEKTLGINPQGIEGATVSSRLNTSLDELGNIKKEALDYLNLLSGPISNSDVKSDANISEEKLNLDFSTRFLYNQSEALKRLIDEVDKFLEDINSKLASHLVENAPNRHTSRSISVLERTSSSVNTSQALMDLNSQDLQSFLEQIIFNHIKYSGSNISDQNRSHLANQIYFDNSSIQDLISTNDVQSVLESIVSADAEYLRGVLLNIASNSKVRSGSVSDPKNGEPAKLLKFSSGSISSIYGKNKIDILLQDSIVSGEEAKKLDIVKVEGLEILEYNKEYYIAEDVSSGDTKITVYGSMDKDLEGNSLSVKIYKNNFIDYSKSGMTLSARYRSNYSGIVNVIASNPNSAHIISSGIRPFEINSSKNTLSITIDETDSYDIDIYDSSVYSTIGKVTLESIIEKINKRASEDHIPIAASKVSTASQDELCIYHLVPNIAGDSKDRSLKITNSNAISSLGLSSLEEVIHYGYGSNKIISNGRMIGSHFNDVFLSDYEIQIGSEYIDKSSGSFITEGIKNGDLIYIEGASIPDDDGCFIIKSVEDTRLTIDHTFNGTNNSGTKALILKNSVSLEDFVFEELSTPDIVQTSGSMFFDIYYNEKDLSLFLDKNMEIAGLPSSSSPIMISIEGFSENFLGNGEEANIEIDSNLYARLIEDPSGTPVYSSAVKITSNGSYTIYSKDLTKYINIIVHMPSTPPSGTTTINFYGKKSNMGRSLKVGSFLFSNTVGKVFGSPGQTGIPLFLNTINNGPIDESKISDSFISNKIGLPMFEATGNFVAFGLNLSGSHSYDSVTSSLEIPLNGGVVYISGKRISVSPGQKLVFNIPDPSIKYFLTIDKFGEISLKKEILPSFSYSGYSPSYGKDEISIAVFDPANDTYQETFARMDSLNDKLDKTIYVSPTYSDNLSEITPSHKKAHFSRISDAVNYARYASKTNGGSYTPNICLLDGYHFVSSTIEINFPVKIFGLNRNVYVLPEVGPEIVTLTGDVSNATTIINKENSIFYISEMDQGLQSIDFEKINFSYAAGQSGLIVGILFGYNSSQVNETRVSFKDLSFTGRSLSFTNSTTYKTFIPIVFQELDASAVKFSQIFSNISLKDCRFVDISTSGYAVMFFVNGTANEMTNVYSKNCYIEGLRSSGVSSEVQIFGVSETIEVSNLSRVFNSSKLSIINSVYEDDTVEV